MSKLSHHCDICESLNTKNKAQVEDESITDTLMDLANYAIMTIIELEDEK